MIRAIALLLCGYGSLSGFVWVARYMWGARNEPRDLVAEAIAYSAIGIATLVSSFFAVLVHLGPDLSDKPWHLLSIGVGVLSSVMFTVWHIILGKLRLTLTEVTQ